MAKDRELQEMKGILPVSARVENTRQNLRSDGDMTETREDIKAEKTEKMSGDIEKDYRMGYNGDIEVDKRNPQHYRKSAEEQQEFFKEKARQKYNDETVIIHTGTESPEDSIDPDDGKVHVWVNPDGVQEIKKEDGTVVEVLDPNIKIFDSRKISSRKEQEAILNIVQESEEFKRYKELYPRGMDSYKTEWVMHNIAGVFGDIVASIAGGESKPNKVQNSTKDVDLNYIDRYGFAYDGDMYNRYIMEKLKGVDER